MVNVIIGMFVFVLLLEWLIRYVMVSILVLRVFNEVIVLWLDSFVVMIFFIMIIWVFLGSLNWWRWNFLFLCLIYMVGMFRCWVVL